jgi:threonine dehydrogenase-like Zn-dependent dehydrogenase
MAGPDAKGEAMTTMRAARLHEVGTPFRIDTVELAEPGPRDVQVQVKACGVVPNLRNVVTTYTTKHPTLPPRKLPAIYGLDATGVVSKVGSGVHGIEVGDRVYVNPALSCGGCDACRRGEVTNCPDFAFQGYFGFGPGSQQLFDRYPTGGFADFLVAPAANLVKLPQQVSFEQGARFGYLGTAYSGLRKACFAPGQTVLIDGMTGTLGFGAALLALAMGAARVFGTGRNEALLTRIKRIAPSRVHPIKLGERPVHEVVRENTDGLGVHAYIGALGPGAPVGSTLESLQALRRGGKAVGIGALAQALPLDPLLMMRRQLSYSGSLWFSVAEGQDMAAMAAAGTLDLSHFEHERFPLERVNQAVEATDQRQGGLTNIVVVP